jgi:formate hydrogenlyase subunit 6/NADH:ubiquinone oxidoreductase subunit I
MTMEKELLKNFTKKPATLHYPYKKITQVDRLRAKVTWNIERCIGCRLCLEICPSTAIEIYGKNEDAEITYNLDKCIFCGECVDVCPTDAIVTTKEYELTYTKVEEMKIIFNRPPNK